MRAAIDKLETDDHEVRPKYGLWQPEYWRRRLPISFLSFKAANGTWIAEWYLPPSLTQKNDFIFFDVVFNRNIARNVEKRLQLQIHTAALRKNPKRWPRLERRPIVLGNLMHVRPVERVGVRYRPADPLNTVTHLPLPWPSLVPAIEAVRLSPAEAVASGAAGARAGASATTLAGARAEASAFAGRLVADRFSAVFFTAFLADLPAFLAEAFGV